MLRFSTIIPAYNRGNLIRETIDSVLKQTFAAENEIIVVDDGSTDDTATVLADYGNRIRVVRIDNSGPGAARNAGIAQAQAEYLCFMDSDDLWLSTALETYNRVIEQCDSPAVIVAAIEPFDKEAPHEQDGNSLKVFQFPDYFASADRSIWHGCSAMICRTEAVRRVGGFSDLHINAEDTDLIMSLGIEKGFVLIEAPITGGYRTHGDSAVANVDRTLAGMAHLIHKERSKSYPGGLSRLRQRRQLITRHLRPAILGALRANRYAAAWRLYCDSFRWNVAERRARFLAGFFLRLFTN